MSASDYRARLEDATDCCGAAREDDELVLVTVGDLRSLLSEAERLRSLVEEAGKVVGDIATDADAFESDHTPTAGFVAGIAFSARSLLTKLKGEGQ